jgi:hypothetical protein
MNINVVDCKRNEVINVKIEVSEQMFIVAPEIINPKFNYMRQRLMDIRKKYMNLYLENTQNYMVYENQLYNEMKDMLIKEMENIYRTEGIMYYTR